MAVLISLPFMFSAHQWLSVQGQSQALSLYFSHFQFASLLTVNFHFLLSSLFSTLHGHSVSDCLIFSSLSIFNLICLDFEAFHLLFVRFAFCSQEQCPLPMNKYCSKRALYLLLVENLSPTQVSFKINYNF